MTPQRPNWHELAGQASRELDPVRLMSLVDELNRAFDENERTSMELQTQNFVDISARLNLPHGGRFLGRAFPVSWHLGESA
jgi:hypothetical protein